MMLLRRQYTEFSSCAILSRVSWELHRVFSCAILSEEYKDNIEQNFFHVQCCLEPLGKYCARFLPVLWCLKRIKTTRKRIFLVECCLKPQGQHYIGYFLCNVVSVVLRQHWTGFFPVHCCLETQGQHCIGIYKVFCHKSIWQDWTWLFWCNFVWSLLDKIALCIYLCNIVSRVLRQDWTGLFRCNVVWSFLDNTAQGFYLCRVVPSVLR